MSKLNLDPDVILWHTGQLQAIRTIADKLRDPFAGEPAIQKELMDIIYAVNRAESAMKMRGAE